MKTTIGFLIIIGAIAFAIIMIITGIKAKYNYEREYASYWELADKSSTIDEKSKYISLFVEKLEQSGLQGVNDALYFPNDNNSFDKNLIALKSLNERLKTIKTMDINSFEYQIAIQQITAQEQGEANAMLNIIENCWWKVNYYYLWNGWLILLWIAIPIVMFVVGVSIIENDY